MIEILNRLSLLIDEKKNYKKKTNPNIKKVFEKEIITICI